MAFAFGFGIFLALDGGAGLLRAALCRDGKVAGGLTGPSDEPSAPTLEDHTDEG